MSASNATPLKTFGVESLTLWNDVTNNLTEFILANWWVLVVVVLLLLSCVKHSLMCWELRQDRRRLQCCYMRHCALLHAANQLTHHPHHPHHQGAATDVAKGKEADKADADACTCNDAAAATPNASTTTLTTTAEAGSATAPHDPPKTPSTNAQAAEPAAAHSSEATPALPHRRRPSDLHAPKKPAEEGGEKMPSRVSSLQLPLTSTSSSDLSFTFTPLSATHQGVSATSRLLNRLSISPNSTEMVSGALRESPPNSGDFTSKRSGCFPRYTEDEQRRMDEKRQANAQAWMEAKRALESTENLASCGLTPTSSTTRRRNVPDSGGAS
ncbi:hypothetical protein ABB37_00667 [Leptomonas pyrrhocoris]|uniref:Transmembrane protein n=1 Tax=Leptomonas pyrrhocoris TaxID=157538 RepID=A0A0N0VI00_LEPPY|nr:hypothetical protein ABB37_00667 [Leptomonas pyrrhocoris]KPA86521.1 hypothetical protein ABB37_00667 [Leptomonas pyrrhocoris]|eukprot:XP_015664960.1 hypothetical protein ABB37_00667 [Leptomonas pyrrhocoris]